MKSYSVILALFSFSLYAAHPVTQIIEQPGMVSALASENSSDSTSVEQSATQGIVVHFDTEVLFASTQNQTDQSIILDLENSRRIEVQLKKVRYRNSEMDFSWFGSIAGEEKGKAIITVKDGIVSGSIYINGDSYSIIHENDSYKIIKNDPDRIVPFHDDVLGPVIKEIPLSSIKQNELEQLEGDTDQVTLSTANYSESETLGIASGSQPSIEADTPDTDVNVMLLYNDALVDKYGVATAESMIQNYFDIAQDAYLDSLTGVNLNLVHMAQLPNSSSLNATYDYDGVYTQLGNISGDLYINNLREQYSADVVVLLGAYNGSQGLCGLGYTPNSVTDSMIDAFSVVLIKPASEGGTYCSDLTLSHEIGHNFGCQHDRDHTTNDDTGNSMYTYSFGYDVPNTFATIMSYDNPEIPYFSNPDITDDGSGLFIGVADSEDNARTIRNTKAEVADNSEETSWAPESGDTLSGMQISGQLSSNDDKDLFSIALNGSTTFDGSNYGYYHWYFFISLYNSDYELVSQFDGCDDSGNNCVESVTVDLPYDTYYVRISTDGEKYGWNIDTANYTIDITTQPAPNSNPVATDDSVSAHQGATIAVDVLANDSDSDGDTLTITGIGTTGTVGSVQIGDNQVQYTAPVAPYEGEDTFTYTIEDGNGGIDSATVVVTVTASTDSDNDGINDETDNCPETANSDQADMDGDGIGNVCDPDIDGDGTANGDDIFPYDSGTRNTQALSLMTYFGFEGIDLITLAGQDSDGDGFNDLLEVQWAASGHCNPNIAESAIEEAQRRMPATVINITPLLFTLNAAQTIEATATSYADDDVLALVIFECDGGTNCGSTFTGLTEGTDYCALKNPNGVSASGSATFLGEQAYDITYSYDIDLSDSGSACYNIIDDTNDVVVRFYQYSRADYEAGKKGISALIGDRDATHYDDLLRRISVPVNSAP